MSGTSPNSYQCNQCNQCNIVISGWSWEAFQLKGQGTTDLENSLVEEIFSFFIFVLAWDGVPHASLVHHGSMEKQPVVSSSGVPLSGFNHLAVSLRAQLSPASRAVPSKWFLRSEQHKLSRGYRVHIRTGCQFLDEVDSCKVLSED